MHRYSIGVVKKRAEKRIGTDRTTAALDEITKMKWTKKGDASETLFVRPVFIERQEWDTIGVC